MVRVSIRDGPKYSIYTGWSEYMYRCVPGRVLVSNLKLVYVCTYPGLSQFPTISVRVSIRDGLLIYEEWYENTWVREAFLAGRDKVKSKKKNYLTWDGRSSR